MGEITYVQMPGSDTSCTKHLFDELGRFERKKRCTLSRFSSISLRGLLLASTKLEPMFDSSLSTWAAHSCRAVKIKRIAGGKWETLPDPQCIILFFPDAGQSYSVGLIVHVDALAKKKTIVLGNESDRASWGKTTLELDQWH